MVIKIGHRRMSQANNNEMCGNAPLGNFARKNVSIIRSIKYLNVTNEGFSSFNSNLVANKRKKIF